MSESRWNTDELKNFIREFDPLQKRYLQYAKNEEAAGELMRCLECCHKVGKEERWNLEEIEDTYLTVKKVYSEVDDDFCGIIEGASEKFLDQYVDIEGMEQLFKSSYFYFEWMMHLEYNRNKHDYTYYRDHYVHQVRNMYEMFQFLDKLRFEKKCREIYAGLDNKVGRLIRKSIVEEQYNMSGEERSIWDTAHLAGDELEEMLYSYLFHASAIVASLLHDIGYPIAYVGRTVKELGGFLPFTNLFVEEVETMATIHSVLQDSLLYQVAGQKEVASKVSKRDHGALSAVVLLYKYYDNGKIARMSPVKRAVIELSALMIYNHTMKFENMGASKGHHYKNVFQENPMSYLFRLCDDLQEWKRSYFEISRQSNFFICGKCHMPLTRDAVSKEAQKDQKAKGEKEYSCWCGKRRGINTTTFAYRRLYNVEACREIELDKKQDAGYGNRESMTIFMKYDKGKMLQLAAYSPNFALKRAEGVCESKRMLREQPEFPDTFLDFMVSNNPIMLKAEILAEWFESRESSFYQSFVSDAEAELEGKNIEEVWSVFDFVMVQMTKVDFYTNYQKDYQKLRNWLMNKRPEWKGRSGSTAYIWKKLFFYYDLALWGHLLQHVSKKELVKKEDSIAETVQKLRNLICPYFHITGRDEKDLVEAYLRQKLCQFDLQQYQEIRSEKEWELYFHSFIISPGERNVVKSYVSNWEYEELKDSAWAEKGKEDAVKVVYDYYSDYYLYYTIAVEIEKNG